ncbi:MAG: hypothetical protein JW786_11465 [Desulfobacterales bacterium]|nr:hypothetical protein [Desulfobacterales bacterium]
MNTTKNLIKFNVNQLKILNNSVSMAEELTSNFYKMSASQWLRPKYDIKTLAQLIPSEIVFGPFAQIIRYKGQRKNMSLSSSVYDFYKICIQDHSILSALKESPILKLFPFTLYIVTHELIHIVRFSKFLQNFDASFEEKQVEEKRVHEKTHEILSNVRVRGLTDIFKFYHQWHLPIDGLKDPLDRSFNVKKINTGS